MKTLSKQTEAQKIINNNLLKTEVKNIFTNYYFSNNYFYIPLEDEKTKVNNIKSLKNYLNINFELYELSIIFLSGIEQKYTTALKIKLIQ